MALRRLVALFLRYGAAHLDVAVQGGPIVDADGGIIGHVDQLRLRGARAGVVGWVDADTVKLTHLGQSKTTAPHLARPDVAQAFPGLAASSPGFAIDLPRGPGPLFLTVIRGNTHIVQTLHLPDSILRRAQARLLAPFLRDLGRAMPILLHWFATRDPADRTRLKRCLRLETQPVARGMQSLLFLRDCMAKLPIARRNAEMARLQPAALMHRAITIVLPVYNAMALLPEALNRVARHTDLPWRLILIEDASPDPEVRPFLRQWAKARNAEHPGRVTLIENTENQGFIGSVNAGLKRAVAIGDHVVLLNSDAFVPAGWASRLMRPFLAHDRVASVTPMSNDAEIFTAPVICQRGNLPPGTADAVDAIAALIHPDAALADAPTGVGFCMAMSIDYLRRVPQLDTVFGRGYGEEVDWCQKTRALGGRHLGLANLYVEHRGGTSFGTTEKHRLIARNGAVISRRFPAYDADVQRFIADDPLVAPRLALAVAWAAATATTAIPLFLAHDLGGGAEDYLADRIGREITAGPVLVLRVGTAMRWQLELHCADGITRGGTDDFALIQRLLEPVSSLAITYSCGVGDTDPVDLPARLLALRRNPRDRVEVLVHDYLPISPSYTLLDRAGRYAGLPDKAQDDPAHRATRPDGRQLGLADWQAAWGALLAAADRIVVFSQSSAGLIRGAYPDAARNLVVAPHHLLVDLPSLPVPQTNRPVIGVLGNIGYHKGAAVLGDLGAALAAQGAADLVLLGRIDPAYAPKAGVKVHGGYLRHDLPGLIAQYGIDRWLIPSIWPETFSYTTHEALATGLPVWCFDLGAQADAVRQAAGLTGQGGVIPLPGGKPDFPAMTAAILAPPVPARLRPKAAA